MSAETKSLFRSLVELFPGKEMVDWILSTSEFSYMTRDDAAHLSEQLRVAGFLVCATDKRKMFADDSTQFKFDKTTVWRKCEYATEF